MQERKDWVFSWESRLRAGPIWRYRASSVRMALRRGPLANAVSSCGHSGRRRASERFRPKSIDGGWSFWDLSAVVCGQMALFGKTLMVHEWLPDR